MSYDLKCEDAPSHYGHGYGKDQSKVKMSTMSHGWHPMSRNFDPGVLQQTQNLPSHLKYHPGDPGKYNIQYMQIFSLLYFHCQVPEKQCENRPVMLPRVNCEEVVVSG